MSSPMLSRGHQAPKPPPGHFGDAVIAFRSPAASGSVPQIGIAAGDRLLPPVSLRHRPALPLLLLGSVLAHAAAVAVIYRAPQPVVSAGLPVVSVEIVVGDNRAAGVANTLGQEGVTEVQPIEPARTDATVVDPEPARPLAVAETVTARTPDTVTPEPVQEPRASEIVRHDTPVSPDVAPVAPASQPVVAAASAASSVPEHRADTSLRPMQAMPIKRRPDELAARQATEVRTRQPVAAAPSTAASGIGRGGSAAAAAYDGRVAAHLARHKRFPRAARHRRQQGSAQVGFSIDGRGRVTAVRIVRSSGIASLDRAAEAMVWRASPFPAPPDRRPQRFSVPVSYSIR